MSGTPTTHQHETTLEPVTSLTPHPENPRRGATAAIVDSIRANGFCGALIAQRSTRHIIAGNHRLQAAITAGLQEVPVIWLDVTDEQARRILLADNRTSDLGAYDTTALADLLASLPETALIGTGYDPSDAASLLAAAAESGEDPGGYVARNPKNHADQWYVAQTYFDENLEPLEEPVVARDEAAELRAAIKAWAKALDAESGAQSAAYAAAQHEQGYEASYDAWRAAQDRLGEAEERLYALAATEGQP